METQAKPAPLLEVRNLKTYFPVKKKHPLEARRMVKAVDGVSFSVYPGETFGLVGESGCGKSTLGKSILRLVEPSSGEIFLEGEEISALRLSQLRRKRNNMQIIFQDPYSSLNPRMKVKEIIAEPMAAHLSLSRKALEARVTELMDSVGLASHWKDRYPHEFSGGQRQRIGIARALGLNPKLIVCDEPVSALDVSIQSQILNLLVDLQERFGLTYLFIAHGIAVVRHISDRVGVMYLGHLVEVGTNLEVCENPLHPYTKALMSAIPVPNPAKQAKRVVLQGDVPSPLNPPKGCCFHTRCPQAMEVCGREAPAEIFIGSHSVCCHLYKKSGEEAKG